MPRLCAGAGFLRLRGGAERTRWRAYEDQDRLAEFAEACDVITYEFENVPAQTAAFLAQRKPVLPDPKVLAITQDRLIEKDFIDKLGIATAPYAPVGDAAQLFEAAQEDRPAGDPEDAAHGL